MLPSSEGFQRNRVRRGVLSGLAQWLDEAIRGSWTATSCLSMRKSTGDCMFGNHLNMMMMMVRVMMMMLMMMSLAVPTVAWPV